MTLEAAYLNSRTTALFKNVEIKGWKVIVEDVYSDGGGSPDHRCPSHFRLVVRAVSNPTLTEAQRSRFKRALRACPVKQALQAEVLVDMQ